MLYNIIRLLDNVIGFQTVKAHSITVDEMSNRARVRTQQLSSAKRANS